MRALAIFENCIEKNFHVLITRESGLQWNFPFHCGCNFEVKYK